MWKIEIEFEKGKLTRAYLLKLNTMEKEAKIPRIFFSFKYQFPNFLKGD